MDYSIEKNKSLVLFLFFDKIILATLTDCENREDVNYIMSRENEEQHLTNCLQIIMSNIERYEMETKEADEQIKDMFDHYHSDNPEMYTMLSNAITMNEFSKNQLRKNRTALLKPYFGRIDYTESNKEYSLYLGKNGISKSATEIEVIDWRAPIATIYYENEHGPGIYTAPKGEIDINLNLKRTYEIENSKLLDFYDSQTVTNDELLTKYLAKNKEEVLGEIIATIQKEQNEIIRQTPFRNCIVQGVAGSGKTTVAMHRISFILYNYKEKFKPSEFFIVGSNRMLLNYITAVLPELDVRGVSQMTMEELMIWLLEDDYSEKKVKVISQEKNGINPEFTSFKGSTGYMAELSEYLSAYERRRIPDNDVVFKDEVLYTKESVDEFIRDNPDWSMQQKIIFLNTRLNSKLDNILSSYEYETGEKNDKKKPYKNHYGKDKFRESIYEIYYDFVEEQVNKRLAETIDNSSTVVGADHKDDILKGYKNLEAQIAKKKYDVYDLAALNFIRWRLKLTEKIAGIKHVVVDEAQDYGTFAFGVLHRILPECTFTIMGDVSQNINYDAGMNDWEALREEIFSPEKDYFSILAKSYRNTIEISEYATSILKKCSFRTYDIEPIIRHGRPVKELKSASDNITTAVDEIRDWQGRGYDTIAVICRDEKEAIDVRDRLAQHLTVRMEKPEDAVFGRGIMVLPIQLTKGLEFDTVLLWDVTPERYPMNDANAKLLYVAATRALHELTVIGTGKQFEMN